MDAEKTRRRIRAKARKRCGAEDVAPASSWPPRRRRHAPPSGAGPHEDTTIPGDQAERLELIAPTLALKDAFLEMVADFEAAGERQRLGRAIALATQDFAAYLQLLDDWQRGVNLPLGFVPQDLYWLVRDNTTVLGTTAVRHELMPPLEDAGGHIGYNIRPSERRKGYGTRILALALDRARARGLNRVLLTCDMDNIGSARIIEKNGGVLASQGFSPIMQTHVSRYWIQL